MTGDGDDDDVPLADAKPPEEWAESIAAAEGIPPEDVVERLVSSYWTLTEVYEMLNGSEGDIGLAAASDINSGGGGMVENGEGAPSVEDAEDAPAVEDDKDAPTVEGVRELGERLDRLEEGLRAQQDSHASIEADLGQLTQRMDGLEGELKTRQSSIESRLDAELENLETILSYLVDSTEAIDEDLGSILEEWPTIRDTQEQRERLIDLKRTASQLGVRSGECERCGTSVDIGVLPTADCPDCGGEFVDIEPASGWFGMGTDTLVTAKEPAIEPDDAEGGPRDSGDGEGGLLDW